MKNYLKFIKDKNEYYVFTVELYKLERTINYEL